MESEPSDVQVLDKWKSLLADDDDLARAWELKARIAIAVGGLRDLVPKYSEKDFLVVNRKQRREFGQPSSGPTGPSSPWRSSWPLAPPRSRRPT